MDKGNKNFLDEADNANDAACMSADPLEDRKSHHRADLWNDPVSVCEAISEGIYDADKEQIFNLITAIRRIKKAGVSPENYHIVTCDCMSLCKILLDATDRQIETEVFNAVEKEGFV